MPPNPEASMPAIQLPEQIERRLDDLAKATGRSNEFYVQEGLPSTLAILRTTTLQK
jgi:predicted DNA-binding protein